MRSKIADQAVVIVGASSGIGLACAREFARRGARVALAARNEKDLEQAAAEIRRAGGEAIVERCDVTVYEDVERLARRAASEYGRIDTWVHAAAVSLYGPFRDNSLEDFRRVMEVNFMGQVHGARAALPYLEETRGALICVGSALSDRGAPLQSAYCASKHALKGWLDSLRVELKQQGSKVRVTLVKPASINTPLFKKAKTLMGVEPRPIPPVYGVEVPVRAILRAAEGNLRDVYAGGAGKLLASLDRVTPGGVDAYQRYRDVSSQRSEWPKEADGENNLYAPVAWDGGIEGDFGDKVKPGKVFAGAALPGVRWIAAGMAAAAVGVAWRLAFNSHTPHRHSSPAGTGAERYAGKSQWR